MNDSKMLSHRMMSIESLVLGQDYINNDNNFNVIERIDGIIKLMNNVDTQLPILNQCRDIASKLRPYILQGKINLAQIGEKVNELLVLKNELHHNISLLNDIDKHKHVIDNDYEWDTISMETKLNELEKLIDPLIVDANNQTKELDIFLDNYENCMRLASGITTHTSNIHQQP